MSNAFFNIKNIIPDCGFNYVWEKYKANFAQKKPAFVWRVILNGEHAKTKFALWASEVIFDSEVHFVSEVSPDGEVMGKLNFTCA